MDCTEKGRSDKCTVVYVAAVFTCIYGKRHKASVCRGYAEISSADGERVFSDYQKNVYCRIRSSGCSNYFPTGDVCICCYAKDVTVNSDIVVKFCSGIYSRIRCKFKGYRL